MDPSWAWPGARWWRCDLHLHTPASHDFRPCDATPAQWVDAAVAAGLQVVAVTDHDSGAWVDKIRAAAEGRDLAVFAGVEVTSQEGVHTLALYDEVAGTARVDDFLSRVGVPVDARGLGHARSELPVEQLLHASVEQGWLSIAAHADRQPQPNSSSQASLMTNFERRRGDLLRILDDPALAAAEVADDDPERHAELRGVGRPGRRRRAPGLALLRFSDAHRLNEIGQRSTWIKMTAATREGLELALSDGDHSVVEHADGRDPNVPPVRAIESLTIRDLKHAGRGAPLHIAFSPWLTVIIGGRGAGKSTIINALRITLRRDVDVHGPVRSDLDEFARIGTRRGPGALTDETHLEVRYRRDGHALRAGWSQDGAAPPLQEPTADGGWQVVDGDVRQRLPARILGQGELNALAEDPRRILALADETPEVDRREWQSRWDVEQAQFLSLGAQARQTAATLPDVSELRGELVDVTRSLAVLEAPEHRDTLRRLQQARTQRSSVERWRESLAAASGGVLAAAKSAAVEDPPLDRFADDADRDVHDALRSHAAEVDAALMRVVEAARSLDELVKEGPESDALRTWTARLATAEAAYEALGAELAASGGVDPTRYGELVSRRQELESRLQGVDRTREAVEHLEQQARDSLARLAALRTELSHRRSGFFADISAHSQLVRFDVVALGERDGVDAELRELLLGDPGATTFAPELDECVKRLGDEPATSAQALTALKALVRAGAEAIGGKFATRVRALRPEALDRLDAWFPDDRLQLSYRDADGGWRAISQGSTGQKNAAILAFLLSYGDEPLVIDQPENDLDNALISELVVAQLRESKPRRQLIIVTHNPNVVVNADADYVIALEFKNGQVGVRQRGGLQEQVIRDEVCRIVEGGREAFESRYSRIGRKRV